MSGKLDLHICPEGLVSCSAAISQASFWTIITGQWHAGPVGMKTRSRQVEICLISRLRSQGPEAALLGSTATMAGYGWALHQHAHPAVILVLQFMQGFWGTFFYTTYSALLVDSFPQSPSTAAATTSVTRCAMAATGVAILQPLMDATGRGWYFTALGLWSGIFCSAAILLLRWRGMRWREERLGVRRN